MDTTASKPAPAPQPAALPQDVQACHAMIQELLDSLEKARQAQAQLEAKVQQLLQRLFGPRSEKIDPAQLVMFGEQMAQAAQPQPPPDEPESPAAPKKKGHGRKRISKDIPRIRIEHTVPPEKCVCEECGRMKEKIGEEVTEQLDYTPASLMVYQHVQPILACRCCQEHVVTAPKPPQPIEKGLPGPGLMAHVITSKYCDHLPLYRQEGIFARHGVRLARTTLCGWVMSAAELVVPVVDAMIDRVLQSKVIHTDDTPVRVQGDKASAYTGRFWVYVGDANHPFTVYDYTPSRKRDGPMAFLKEFGKDPAVPCYLQADAFGGYDGIYAASSILEVACMTHARRKFWDARASDPLRAHQVLGWIRQLYAIETAAKTLDAAARAALRQEQAGPILDAWYKWMVDQMPHVLPKSPIGQAIQYALNQWTALNRYLQDGDLDIDNNAAERALRGIAIGRRNWMFLGNDRGGRAAARFYGLIVSAKQNGLEPFAYLRDLFLRIPTHPNKALADLLPDRWKPAA
jgi:transposase